MAAFAIKALKDQGAFFRFDIEVLLVTCHLQVQHAHLVVGVVGVVKNGKDIANCEDHRGQPGGPKGEVWEKRLWFYVIYGFM